MGTHWAHGAHETHGAHRTHGAYGPGAHGPPHIYMRVNTSIKKNYTLKNRLVPPWAPWVPMGPHRSHGPMVFDGLMGPHGPNGSPWAPGPNYANKYGRKSYNDLVTGHPKNRFLWKIFEIWI